MAVVKYRDSSGKFVKIPSSYVTEEGGALTEGSVGTAELRNSAVTTPKIADGNVTKTKLSQEVQNAVSQIESLQESKKELSDKIADMVGAIESSVQGISVSDKILSLEANKLILSTLNLFYDSSNKAIKLTGKDGAELGSIDATPFIKDGMLNDVSYNKETNALTFTWNTDSGKQADTVILSDIMGLYTAGNGLQFEGNEFSVKVADDNESFLSVDENGLKILGIQNAIDNARDDAIADAKTHANELNTTIKDQLNKMWMQSNEDSVIGHKGYYIHSINTAEKWVILSDSSTKPNYPTIGSDVTDDTTIDAPYAGVYEVTSEEDVTITNETGSTVTLTAGESGYIFLIKGRNSLQISDKSANLTFTALEDNGKAYYNQINIPTEPIITEKQEDAISALTNVTLYPGESYSFTYTPSMGLSGIVYPYLAFTTNTEATIRVTTDTGFYADIYNPAGVNYSSTAWADAAHNDPEMLYIRSGAQTITLENIGSTTVVFYNVRIHRAGADSLLSQEAWFSQMKMTELKVEPLESSSESGSFSYTCFETGYAVGDEFSMVNGAHYDFCGTITTIEGRKIYYAEDLPFNVLDASTNDFDDHIFFVPSKPEVGVVPIVTLAFASGIGTKAVGKASFGAGRDCIAGGDYSFVGGRRTLAAYCAAALGLDTFAKGRYSFAACRLTQALGEYSAAINMSTTARGEASFAHGKGTVAYTEAMEAGGKWNKTKEGKIVVYGNGYANADGSVTESDAYMLDWDGNGWFAGSVKVGGIGPNHKNALPLATENYVNNSILSLGETLSKFYATISYVDSSIENLNLAEYVKKSELADLVAQIINNMNLTPAFEDGNEVEY